MADRENVIRGLECRAYDNDFPCTICNYYKRDDEHAIPYCDYRGLLGDAIELLKEQEGRFRRATGPDNGNTGQCGLMPAT